MRKVKLNESQLRSLIRGMLSETNGGFMPDSEAGPATGNKNIGVQRTRRHGGSMPNPGGADSSDEFDMDLQNKNQKISQLKAIVSLAEKAGNREIAQIAREELASMRIRV